MSPWYALLAVPMLAMLAVPMYAGADPDLAGVPFFYWYQFAWIIGGAILTWIVYRATASSEGERDA